jgi:hypothetical protein
MATGSSNLKTSKKPVKMDSGGGKLPFITDTIDYIKQKIANDKKD